PAPPPQVGADGLDPGGHAGPGDLPARVDDREPGPHAGPAVGPGEGGVDGHRAVEVDVVDLGSEARPGHGVGQQVPDPLDRGVDLDLVGGGDGCPAVDALPLGVLLVGAPRSTGRGRAAGSCRSSPLNATICCVNVEYAQQT